MINQAVEILLVEDDPQDLRLMLRELESVRNKIEIARDGEAALDFVFGRGAHGDGSRRRLQVIFLDLKLPKVDGLDVLREIKADPKTRAIPVVVLTSSKEERDMVESYKLGVNSYVQKPVDFEQFRQAVKTLGLYWLLVNQTPPVKAFEADGF